MSISDVAENAILNLIFRATAWANVADNAASSPLTNTHVALAVADPGDSGTMSTSETSYTSYARQNVARSTGWTAASGGSVSLAANLDYPQCTGSTATISNFSVGKTGGGAADVYWTGTVTPNISVSTGVIPRLDTSTSLTLA